MLDNFPSSPGSDLPMLAYSLVDCYPHYSAFYFAMDPFYSEEESEAILAVAADSSTSSGNHQVNHPIQEIASSSHLEALNQCVENMVSGVKFLQDGYVVL